MTISRLQPRALRIQPAAPRPVAATPVARKTPKSAFELARTKGPALDGRRPPVTAKIEALKRARELLEGPVKNTTGADGHIVVEDAPYVNDGRDLNGPRADEAARQVADNVALEGEALDKLSAKDRARYLSVKRTLLAPADGRPQGDPVAALALQTMLLEGKLTAPLLTNLSKLNQQELADGIDRQQLLADVVQEVAVPEAIAQRNRGTCVPTSIEIQLAQQNPAEYVRLISGLASPEGKVTTAGGDVLEREPGVIDDGTSRSMSQKLLAPALMELGNARADYDNEEDEHVGGSLDGKSGLTAAQADVLLESIYGRDFAFTNTGSADEKKAGTEFVLDELKAGRDVLVGLTWGTGGHKVLVTGTETRDGVDYVKIVNPWGRQELISVADFEADLRNVNYDPNA
ncbi:MAG: hypothetical protein Q8N23_19615 [Archangium sp.]|nr:hypothetical protein [Archangium sp.]MDP3154896.1 hypothetical protein [Archangium sp.]MDP3576015.1 hypothetical protein [Archangium sp.]